METRQDFYVGLLTVVAIALVVGALIATSGWGERRYDLYLTAMGRVDSLVERLDRAGLGDSIAAAVAGANRLLGRLDSLASAAQSLTVENRVDLRETVTNLTELSRQLNHFVDELSRRPYRMLTGVKPLPRDTALRDTTRVSVKP